MSGSINPACIWFLKRRVASLCYSGTVTQHSPAPWRTGTPLSARAARVLKGGCLRQWDKEHGETKTWALPQLSARSWQERCTSNASWPCTRLAPPQTSARGRECPRWAPPVSGTVSPGHADPRAGGGMRRGVCLSQGEPQRVPRVGKPSHLWRCRAPSGLIETKFSQALEVWVSLVPGAVVGEGGEHQQESNSREWSHQIEAARLGSSSCRGITQHRQATLLFWSRCEYVFGK